jgi:hypothetical protein
MTAVNARLRSAALVRCSATWRRWRARSAQIAGIVLATSIAWTNCARATEPSLDAAVETFVRIVERGEFGAQSIGITRWARPIKVATAGQPTVDQWAALEQHLAAITKRVGLPLQLARAVASPYHSSGHLPRIDLSDPGAVFQILYHLPAHGWTSYLMYGGGEDVWVVRGDVLVIFTEHSSMTQISRILRVSAPLARDVASGSSPCFTMFYTEPKSHELKYGIVVLRTDVPDWTRRRCLHEEMTQVMGLRNDVKGSEITLFDDMPMRRRTDLTHHDWVFLEVLYHERMRPGLAGAELRRVARELLAERLLPRE